MALNYCFGFLIVVNVCCRLFSEVCVLYGCGLCFSALVLVCRIRFEGGVMIALGVLILFFMLVGCG